MNNKPEQFRLIKDPFYQDLTFMDFEPVLKDLNDEREDNDLYTKVEERDLVFDKQRYIEDYVRKIGAKKPHLTPHNTELWYYASLETIADLKQYGSAFEWDSLADADYIDNYMKLATKVYEDDRINQANDLASDMAEQVWKHGGRHLGSNYMDVITFDFDGVIVKFWVDSDRSIQFKPGFEPSQKIVDLLDEIKKEVE